MEGRVEVRYNNEWGTICNDGWNINNANVICKMLGHKKAIKIKSFGPGSGRIWLDDVTCKGTETSIDKCHHRGWGIDNCAHTEDSGIMCLPRGKMFTYPSIGLKYDDVLYLHLQNPLR